MLLHQEENDRPDEDNVNILHYIHGIFRKFWSEGKVPPDLKRSILKPFLKDGAKDSRLPKNYRPISLLNSLMKTYEQVIKARLVGILEEKNFLVSTRLLTEKAEVRSTIFWRYRRFFSTIDIKKLALEEEEGNRPFTCVLWILGKPLIKFLGKYSLQS